MAKSSKKAAVFFIIFALTHFCADSSGQASQAEKRFVKGSLSDKIQILKELENNSSVPDVVSIAERGLDFAVENASVLESDPDFRSLVEISVDTFPSEKVKVKKIKKSLRKKIAEKFMVVFKLFKGAEDKKIRSSIIKKIGLYSGDDEYKNLLVDFLNDYLSTAFKADEKAETVEEGAIKLLGEIGDEESLMIVYNIWIKKIWQEYKNITDEALVLLSSKSLQDALKIFSASNISDSAYYFSILKSNLEKNSKNSSNFLCDVAENALFIAITNAEKLKTSGESEKSFAGFQREAHDVLCDNKWSHAASVINSSVILFKKSYDGGNLSDEDFVHIIESSVNVPSAELAKSLTDMLSECNGKVAKNGEMPAKSVVLALISALGELGDKTAFDALLYVTYLSYPIEVIDSAKSSLAKLNW